MDTIDCVRVLVPGNGSKLGLEIRNQLQDETNIHVECSDNPGIAGYDIYVVAEGVNIVQLIVEGARRLAASRNEASSVYTKLELLRIARQQLSGVSPAS